MSIASSYFVSALARFCEDGQLGSNSDLLEDITFTHYSNSDSNTTLYTNTYYDNYSDYSAYMSDSYSSDSSSNYSIYSEPM
jgi:hypothetical protein